MKCNCNQGDLMILGSLGSLKFWTLSLWRSPLLWTQELFFSNLFSGFQRIWKATPVGQAWEPPTMPTLSLQSYSDLLLLGSKVSIIRFSCGTRKVVVVPLSFFFFWWWCCCWWWWCWWRWWRWWWLTWLNEHYIYIAIVSYCNVWSW